MATIMAALDAGFPDGRRYSNHHLAGERGAWHVVMKHMPNLTKSQARQMVDAWIKNGALIEQDYHDPVVSKQRKGCSATPIGQPTIEVRPGGCRSGGCAIRIFLWRIYGGNTETNTRRHNKAVPTHNAMAKAPCAIRLWLWRHE